MIIIEDSRQKKGFHEIKHAKFQEYGDRLERYMLPFGDYALPPRVSIDTKANMGEIASNIGREHERFRRELIRAKRCKCHLYILIENDEDICSIDDVRGWTNPRLIDYPDAITGEHLAKAMATMQDRYGCTFLFCTPEQSAGIIRHLLEQGV